MKKAEKPPFIFIVILLSSIIWLLIPSFFAFPAADDYCYALNHEIHGFFFIEEYMLTNGRWASALFLQSCYLFVENHFLYRLMPLIWLLLSWTSLYFFFRSFQIKFNKTKTSISAIVITIIIFYLLPNISEGLFWFTGAINYTLPFIIALFGWTLLKKANKEKNIPIYILAFILLFTASSFNEIALFMIPFSTWWIFKKEIAKIGLYAISISLIALLIFILSPGNLHRAGEFSVDYSNINLYVSGLVQLLRFSFIFLFLNPLVWYLVYVHYSTQKESNFSFSYRFIIPLIVLLPAIFLPVFATGILGQHRSINFAFMLFIILLIFNNKDLLQKNTSILHKILALIILSLFISANGLSISEDLYKGRFHSFKDIMNNTLNNNLNSISYKEEIPYSLQNQYPVEGWNKKGNFCAEFYFIEKKK